MNSENEIQINQRVDDANNQEDSANAWSNLTKTQQLLWAAAARANPTPRTLQIQAPPRGRTSVTFAQRQGPMAYEFHFSGPVTYPMRGTIPVFAFNESTGQVLAIAAVTVIGPRTLGVQWRDPFNQNSIIVWPWTGDTYSINTGPPPAPQLRSPYLPRERNRTRQPAGVRLLRERRPRTSTCTPRTIGKGGVPPFRTPKRRTTMALVEYGEMIRRLIGSIGATTFARTQAGEVAKSKPRTCNADTAAEAQARLTLSTIAKAWLGLTKTQQTEWTAAGQAHPQPNKAGRYRPISGFALFCQLNINLINAGQPIATNPPTDWTIAPVQTPSVEATQAPIATTQIAAAWSQQTEVNSQIVVKAGPPTPWGQRPTTHQLRTVATFPPLTSTPQLIGDAYAQVYGELPLTVPYQVLFRFEPINAATGVAGTPVDFVMSIGSTSNSDTPAPGTAPGSAPTIAESTNYYFTGDTANEAWLALEVTTGITYTVVWTSTNDAGSPTLQAGPYPSAVLPIRALSEQDAYTFTAQPNTVYLINSEPWTAGSMWSITYAPAR